MNRLCPHGDRTWRCPTCCLMDLRRDLPRLDRAVRQAEKGSGSGRSTFGSRVPAGFGTSALALLQDINNRGGLDYIERELNTLQDPEPLNLLRRRVRQYRSRAALILRDALAPYPLVWPVHGPLTDGRGSPLTDEDGTQREGWRDKPIPCPVIDDTGPCDAALLVHRDNDPTSADYGKAAVIRCLAVDDHEWTLRDAGWLRLGVLLGGVA